MSLWNFIGEVFLFRWLWGEVNRKSQDSSVADLTLLDHDYTDDYHEHDHLLDDFYEEQDDYDMMEDF
ncbi:MAG: hypothetical protein K2L93_06645 [Muribaculaceae bacterium]|nr:hypothetical protein [Muribaculaceae bacterium]